MPEKDSLEELFELLKRESKREENVNGYTPSSRMRKWEKYLLTGIAIIGVFTLAVAIVLNLTGVLTPFFTNVAVICGSLVLGLVMVYMVTVLVQLLQLFMRQKKRQPYEVMFANMKCAMVHDLKLTERLAQSDKATLAYGLLHYRNCWSSESNRESRRLFG